MPSSAAVQPPRLPALVAALWWGSLSTVGFLVVPLLFAHLPTPALAGGMAARLFAAQTWVSIACSVVLLLISRPKGSVTQYPWAQAAIIFILGGMLLALLSQKDAADLRTRLEAGGAKGETRLVVGPPPVHEDQDGDGVVNTLDVLLGAKKLCLNQAAYVGAYGRSTTAAQGPDGIEFTVGAETEVKRLAETVGFRYRWDAQASQYAHAAGVFVLTPQGKLATTLTGVKFPGEELQKELISADQELSHAPLQAVLMRCYVYDSRKGAFVVDPRLLMKLGAGMTILALASVVWRVARPKKPKQPRSEAPPMAPETAPQISDDERSTQ